MANVKKWLGSIPSKCDVCGKEIKNVFIDGKLKMGPWAFMCEKCHKSLGVGLGEGLGQKYVLKKNDWVKMEG